MTASAGSRSGQDSSNGKSSCSIVGESTRTRQLVEDISRVAPYDASVLITGPSGTGKELVARELHLKSSRSDGLFIPVDCALLTGELMSAQLFGQVVGAFTGATHATLGCFRAAEGGTLFLDEIGEMPLPLQAKLLRAIQERAVTPVGGQEPVPVDVRIVAATNRDLKSETAAGRFREDLYYRLNVVHLQTSALCERRRDIGLLADHFLTSLTREGHPRKLLSPGAAEALERFSWPGNVRQLRNVLEQAAIESEGGLIGMSLIEDLLADAASPQPSVGAEPLPPPVAGPAPPDDAEVGWETLAEHERAHLIATLERTYYNRSVAARLLGITRQTLLRRMSKHGIKAPHLPGMPKR